MKRLRGCEAMKNQHEKVYSESRKHKTPAGGVSSTIFYYDDHWNPVDKNEATKCDIHEYDENGALIQSTIGTLNRKNRR